MKNNSLIVGKNQEKFSLLEEMQRVDCNPTLIIGEQIHLESLIGIQSS